MRFEATGQPGLLRPTQPSDLRPIPVLVDPQTAAAASSGGRLELTVDGQPVNARVVGALRRLPTVDSSVAGFDVADEARLAGAGWTRSSRVRDRPTSCGLRRASLIG